MRTPSFELIFEAAKHLTWFSIESIWLFFPILAANQMGHFPYWKTPVSALYLGANKTQGAYIAGPLYAASTTAVLWVIEPALSTHFGVLTFWDALRVGAIIGLGVVLGDHGNSRLKRMRGVAAGDAAISDGIDWAIGGGIAAWLFAFNVELTHVLALIDIAAPAHVYFNRNSYRRGWRKSEH